MKKLMIGAATSLAMVAGASAADLPPQPAPAWNWTGCYVGGNVGGGLTTTSAADTSGYNYGSLNAVGAVGGTQIGCDFQLGAFVFGVQGLLDGTGMTSSIGTVTNSSAIPWLATVTSRIGFTAMPTILIYAKGGAAWVQDGLTMTTVATSTPVSAGYTASGWTAGGGVEWMLVPHWSVFVEYDYVGLSNRTPTFIPTPPFPIGVSQNVQMGVAGVNFRF
jgi:outer membrane immunogenic protein